jgi:hypothetical protein
VELDHDSAIYFWAYERVKYRRYNSVGKLDYLYQEKNETHRYRLIPFEDARWQEVLDADFNAYSWDYTHWIDRPGGTMQVDLALIS